MSGILTTIGVYTQNSGLCNDAQGRTGQGYKHKGFVMMMSDHYRVLNVRCSTMPEVSPNTAVGTKGSLGTAGGNMLRKCSKFQRYLKHR